MSKSVAAYGGLANIPADGTSVKLVDVFLPEGTYVLDIELSSTLTGRPNATVVGNGTILFGPSSTGTLVYQTAVGGSLVSLMATVVTIGTALIVDFSTVLGARIS